MTRLIGGHTNHTDGGIPELVWQWKPAAWLVMNPSQDWAWNSRNLPTRFVWRPHLENDPDWYSDPEGAARQVVEATLAWAGNVSGGWWQGLNEPTVSSAGDVALLARFEVERVKLLAQHGLKAGIGAFAEGNPAEFGWWRHFFPALEEAKRHDGVLLLHEYWWSDPLDPWHALRHRKVYDGDGDWKGLPNRLKLPLIVSECGRDYGTVEQGVVRGWAGAVEQDIYQGEIEAYDAALVGDPYVVGACVFCCGNRSFLWTGYEIWEQVARMLAAQARPLYRQWSQPQVGIINLVGRLPVHPTERFDPMGKAQRTIIHHTGFNYPGDRQQDSIRVIRSIARQYVERGRPGSPYHFYEDRMGRIFQANTLDVACHHAGQFNPTSYGIAMMAGTHLKDPTPEMVQGVRRTCEILGKPIKAHKELISTYCPGRLDSWWWKRIKRGLA